MTNHKADSGVTHSYPIPPPNTPIMATNVAVICLLPLIFEWLSLEIGYVTRIVAPLTNIVPGSFPRGKDPVLASVIQAARCGATIMAHI